MPEIEPTTACDQTLPEAPKEGVTRNQSKLTDGEPAEQSPNWRDETQPSHNLAPDVDSTPLDRLADEALAEHARGETRPVLPTCPRCDGWGRLHNATGGEWFDCEECGGTGDTPAPRPEASEPYYRTLHRKDCDWYNAVGGEKPPCNCRELDEQDAAPRPEARTGEAPDVWIEMVPAAVPITLDQRKLAWKLAGEATRRGERAGFSLDVLARYEAALAVVARERDEALESLAGEKKRGDFLNETIREHDRQNDEMLAELRRERDEARTGEAARFAARGWDLASIEDACDELERLSCMARTEAARRIAAEHERDEARRALEAVRDIAGRMAFLFKLPDDYRDHPLDYDGLEVSAGTTDGQFYAWELAAALAASPAETPEGR